MVVEVAMDGMAKAFGMAIERSAQFVGYFTKGLEGEDWYSRLPGVPNTAIWSLGHIAYHRALFLELVSGERIYPQEWTSLFAMGCEPLPDPHGYPSTATCLELLDRSLAGLRSYLETATQADLASPPHLPSRFLPTKADVLTHLAAHEAHHTGNLALVRRLLGKEKVI
jgi:uncharacterized damage-inducible protein DinB